MDAEAIPNVAPVVEVIAVRRPVIVRDADDRLYGGWADFSLEAPPPAIAGDSRDCLAALVMRAPSRLDADAVLRLHADLLRASRSRQGELTVAFALAPDDAGTRASWRAVRDADGRDHLLATVTCGRIRICAALAGQVPLAQLAAYARRGESAEVKQWLANDARIRAFSMREAAVHAGLARAPVRNAALEASPG